MAVVVEGFEEIDHGDIKEDGTHHVAVEGGILDAGDQDIKIIGNQSESARKGEDLIQKRGLFAVLFGKKGPKEVPDEKEAAEEGDPDEDRSPRVARDIDLAEHQYPKDEEEDCEERELAAIDQLGLGQIVHFLFC